MEDNKLDPILGNEEENSEIQETVEQEIVDETIDEPVEDAADETVEDAEDDATENDADEDTAEETVAEEAPKKKKKKGKVALIVLGSIFGVIVALIGALLLVGWITMPKADVDQVVLTIGDVDSNTGEFINVYGAYSYYASYYGFSEEEVKKYTMEELTAGNIYYIKGIEAGMTLTDEDKADIEENIASLTSSAESYGMTAEEYLEQNICNGYTLDAYRAYLEKQYIAQKYYADEMEKLEAEYKDADDKVQAEYEGDKASYDLANVSYFYFDSTDETAQDKADVIVEKVKGGMDFAAAIVEVSGNADATPVDRLTGETKSVISGNFSSEAADWVFEIKDGNYVNGKGAVTTFVVDDVVYVLYADNSPSKNEAVPATVNYIKVEVGTDTTVKTEDELKLSAKASATKILAEFENGEKTEAAFTKLQDDCNSGDDTLVTGDTFSAIVAGDANDDAVDAWVFDSARKVGDYALVEGDGCYYILFYTSVNEHPVWYQTALTVILEEARTAWDEQVKAEFEDKTVVYDEAIEEAIAYITSSAQ